MNVNECVGPPDGPQYTECSESSNGSKDSQNSEHTGIKHSNVLHDERYDEVYETRGHDGRVWEGE